MKTKIIPFDLETAKKIQAGEIEGRIVTRNGGEVRILTLDSKVYFVKDKTEVITTKEKGINKPILVEYLDVNVTNGTCYQVVNLFEDGKYVSCGESDCDLFIELQEETPKHEFKPFDKVLMRSPSSGYVCWYPHFYCRYIKNAKDKKSYVSLEGFGYEQCIPYEGNEHLVGTTDEPNKVCL